MTINGEFYTRGMNVDYTSILYIQSSSCRGLLKACTTDTGSLASIATVLTVIIIINNYTQRLHYLHLSTDCFMKISFQSTGLSIEHSTTCDSRTNLNYMINNYVKYCNSN